jgi:hypothetical protein
MWRVVVIHHRTCSALATVVDRHLDDERLIKRLAAHGLLAELHPGRVIITYARQ